jgi:ubiquinone/menaquinone biosynthesis C-methylase UbiE
MRRVVLVAALGAALLLGCGSWKRFAYEGGDRDAWQQPDRVIASLGLRPGDRVADIGAGSGYFTLPLARAVGPPGRVHAVDVDEEMNQYLRERVREAGLENVEVTLGRYEDPLLPDGEIDLIFTSNTYHHIEERPAYFRGILDGLAPGGRVAILDYDGRKGWFVRLVGHYTPKQEILREMEEAGYRLADDVDFLDRQSFLIFTAPPR